MCPYHLVNLDYSLTQLSFPKYKLWGWYWDMIMSILDDFVTILRASFKPGKPSTTDYAPWPSPCCFHSHLLSRIPSSVPDCLTAEGNKPNREGILAKSFTRKHLAHLRKYELWLVLKEHFCCCNNNLVVCQENMLTCACAHLCGVYVCVCTSARVQNQGFMLAVWTRFLSSVLLSQWTQS